MHNQPQRNNSTIVLLTILLYFIVAGCHAAQAMGIYREFCEVGASVSYVVFALVAIFEWHKGQ